jgi:ADP-heptose:LPS heptosyltransferase
VDLTDDIDDFATSAALLAELDLIISVDTAVAHLAGALGCRVWTLLAFAPDWRWGLHRDDTPWYPTMRLFRQPAPGDWNSVIDRVMQELKDLVASRDSES